MMLFVKFANKSGGNVGIIHYLLNEKRVANGTAKVISGDPELTKRIIKSIDRKQKVFAGCLSFEELNVKESIKYQIMKEFEEALLPGLDMNNFNILWVEHTDKNRLELNMVIPKTNLVTGKRLQPYFDRIDRKRMDLWRDLQNLRYGFSSPDDPRRTRTLSVPTKAIGLARDYIELDRLLHQCIEEGAATSRDELIELVEKEGITLTRKGQSYLSLKLPSAKKARRFKGVIYDERFRDIESLGQFSKEASRAEERYYHRDSQAERRALEKDFRQHLDRKRCEIALEHGERSKESVCKNMEDECFGSVDGIPYWTVDASSAHLEHKRVRRNRRKTDLYRVQKEQGLEDERVEQTASRARKARVAREWHLACCEDDLAAANQYLRSAQTIASAASRAVESADAGAKRRQHRRTVRKFFKTFSERVESAFRPALTLIDRLVRLFVPEIKEVNISQYSHKQQDSEGPKPMLRP
ncbi:relaxase/mobilization nuclease domain-containing protein [Sulfurimonas sp. HSL1-6]|uniref:relaxase/mobilization nuclease domain-containing protein n=1 Tax=Thiomicrolovo immobilis TaxID=3131935 RepID=UPI0031F8FF3E